MAPAPAAEILSDSVVVLLEVLVALADSVWEALIEQTHAQTHS